MNTRTKFKTALEYLIVCIIVFVIRAFTLQGPIYNLCAEDNSIFFIVGREMVRGKVLYTEVFDHKGVYTFFIYALANLISQTSQIGVYIIQSTLTCIVMCYLFNTIKKEYSVIKGLVTISISTFVMSITFLTVFGGYNEEYAALGYLVSLILIYKHSDERYNNYKLMFIHGVIVGIILNMKQNYVLFYLPIAIDLFIKTIKDKKYKLLLQNIISGLLGIFIANIPMLVYTIKNNCFSAMIDTLYNISSISTYGEMHIKEFVNFLFVVVLPMVIISILSILIVRHKKRGMTGILVSTLIFTLITSLLTGRVSMHCIEPIIVFMLPFILFIFHKIMSLKNKTASILITFIILCFSMWLNIDFTDIIYNSAKNEKHTSYGTADIYNSKYSSIDDVVYLGYGGVLYYCTDIDVDKYFSLPCIKQSKYSTAIDYNENRIRKEKPGLIIIQDWYMKKIEATLSDDITQMLKTEYTLDDASGESSFYIRNDLVKTKVKEDKHD